MADVHISRQTVEAGARALVDQLKDKPGFGSSYDELSELQKLDAKDAARAALDATARLVVADHLEMLTRIIQEIHDETEISGTNVLRQYSRQVEQLRAQS